LAGRKRFDPFWLIVIVSVLGLVAWWFVKQGADKPVQAEPEEEFRVAAVEAPEPRRRSDAPSLADERRRKAEADEAAQRQQLAGEIIARQMAEREAAEQRRAAEDEQRRVREAEQARKQLEQRRAAKLVVIKGGQYAQDAAEGATGAASQNPEQVPDLTAFLRPAPAPSQTRAFQFVPTAEAAFVEAAAVSPVRPDLSRFLGAGKLIPAVLETGIDSSRPGVVRAIVAEDVFSEDGTVVLLPRGSKLLGEFSASGGVGTRRVGVIWNRAMRSDGIAVPLVSPGADAAGTTGLTGKVNFHFWERFGAALLFSLIDAAGDNANDGQALVVNSGGSAMSSGQQIANIPPTITVKPGARVNAILTRDLDFGAVAVLVP
jgi:type IV secretory pathway VirB10-like protein